MSQGVGKLPLAVLAAGNGSFPGSLGQCSSLRGVSSIVYWVCGVLSPYSASALYVVVLMSAHT